MDAKESKVTTFRRKKKSSCRSVVVEKCFGFTTPTEEQCAFTWTLQHFSHFGADIGNEVTAIPAFSSKDGQCVWDMKFWFFSNSRGEKCVAFGVNLLESSKNNMACAFDMSLRNTKDDEIRRVMVKRPLFRKRASHVTIDEIKKESLIKREDLLRRLVDDVLKVHVEIIVRFKEIPVQEFTNMQRKNLAKHLLSLYKSKNFNDFVICVEGVHIPVHRGILSARSPVFNAIFKGCASEGLTRKEIRGFKFNVIDVLLTFIYTDEVPDMDATLAKDVLAAANKYGVYDLKEICSDYLMKNLDSSNVLNFLLLADTHSETELKCKCIEFLLCHRNSILSHQTPMLEYEKRGSLLFDILVKIMK